jgi:uncharacterized protein (TIGR02147 family)
MNSTTGEPKSRLYRAILLDEFAARKKKNPAYSLRAYARDLSISVTALSDALAQKRDLSKKNLQKISDRLGWGPEKTAKIFGELREQTSEVSQKEFFSLEEDSFRLISDWYYFAILALANTPKPSSNPKWIADQLGISMQEAKVALERLRRLGLISVDSGKLKQKTKTVSVLSNVPSSTIRLFHRENLRLAERSIDEVPMQLRDLGAITFPADPKRLELARKELIKFRRKIARLMEGESPTSVYTLALQLFPVSRIPSEFTQ